MINKDILRKAESTYGKEPWTITTVHMNGTIRIHCGTKMLGCIFLQESSGFLCFPFLWRFFDRNHDSCSTLTFSERHWETCLYEAYVGSYVGFKKELSIWCVLQAPASTHLSHDKEDEPQKPLRHYHNIKQYYR